MRQEQQLTFTSFDDTKIFYRYWPALEASPNKATPTIVLFHRGHEHSLRMAHLIEELNLPHFQFFAWDARGNGQSPGERGDAPSFAALARDAEYFFQHIKRQYQLQDNDIAVIAQSVGAVIAATWVHDYVPNIRALILGSPAFKVKLYVPLAIPGLKLLYNLRGNFFVKSYVKAKLLTHDPERVESFNHDELITPAISVKVLLELNDTSKRIVKDAQAIYVPTQILSSGSDYVVRKKPQKRFFENLSSHKKEYHELPGFYHDIFGEKDRHLVVERAKRFIVECFNNLENNTISSLLNADKIGFTRNEADRLSLPVSNPFKNAYWKINKLGLKYASKLSDGIKLGFDVGFDSGSSLDYIYRNQPSGVSAFGRFIDYLYLQAIGWRGIRERKANMETLLAQTIAQLKIEHKPVRIVDIAAGHGRYILDVINQFEMEMDSVLLRDFSDINVEKGQKLINDRGLSHIARFEKGDAFDRTQLTSLDIKPTIAIVSGFYELFSDNQQVQTSLAGLADSMQSGSYLIYTGQPWHPQLEYIARTLTSHREGQAWLMRRRTQLEMDQLVQAAGFEKIAMKIDDWGIFTVSVAKRV